MEAHLCNHPMVPHTVEYMLSSQTAARGASVVRPFDHLEGADQFAQKIIRQNPARLTWIKIFRSDNSAYSCFVWENPTRVSDALAEDATVKLELDMDPIKDAFDNVAVGFKEQGRAITRLKITQLLLGGAILFDLTFRLVS